MKREWQRRFTAKSLADEEDGRLITAHGLGCAGKELREGRDGAATCRRRSARGDRGVAERHGGSPEAVEMLHNCCRGLSSLLKLGMLIVGCCCCRYCQGGKEGVLDWHRPGGLLEWAADLAVRRGGGCWFAWLQGRGKGTAWLPSAGGVALV